MQNDEHRVWKGLVIGLLAGAAASCVMNEFQAALSKLSESGKREGRGTNGSNHEDQHPKEQKLPATAQVAETVSTRLFHHELTDGEKKLAEPIVHYSFGAAMGGIYGALAEVRPRAAKGLGLPFGTVLWLGADEITVSSLGLGQSFSETTASQHLSALSAHLVYGASTELMRRALRRVWR